ncbi:MAG: hypothetical protein O2960_00985 [Verrucomicrobia bacterium]|nr:hypothetical protein [Verrucomicrobiota bacterium]
MLYSNVKPTDRRRKRALAANPASDKAAHPEPQRGAAVRVERFVYAQHGH